MESDNSVSRFFWMVVRDTHMSRAYMQVIEEYRRNPTALARLLPHRDLEELRRVMAAAAIITWRDLAQPILDAADLEYPEFSEVRDELARRI